MAERSYIECMDDVHGTGYKVVGMSIGDLWLKIPLLGMVSLSLRGHEEHLFKTHLSFKETSSKFGSPRMSPSKPLQEICTLNLPKMRVALANQMSPLLRSILAIEFDGDETHNDEHASDRPYLQMVLTTFVEFPVKSYNEVHLEYKTRVKVVGGSLDVLLGSETNGIKPYVTVHTDNSAQSVAVYLGSLLEAKSSGQPHTSARADTASSFDQQSSDINHLNHAMTELMAVSELAIFPDLDILRL